MSWLMLFEVAVDNVAHSPESYSMKYDTSFYSMEEKVSQDAILLSVQIIIGILILSDNHKFQ